MYLVTASHEPSEIGKHFFQVKDSNIGRAPGTEFLGNFLSVLDKKFEDEHLPQLVFTLHYHAKPSDFIEIGKSWLVTPKLLNILLDANIESYQYFEATVIHRKKEYTYYLFFIYGQNYELLDYKNMTFWGESNAPYSDQYREPHEKIGTQLNRIEVETPNQLINWQSLYPDFPNRRHDGLRLNHANIHSDLIRLPSLIESHYYVSENLKNAITEQKCTGIAFRTKDWQERPIL